VLAVTAGAHLGGTERVLLDLATHAREHGVELRVLTPIDGPLLPELAARGIPADIVPAPDALLRATQRAGGVTTWPRAAGGLAAWAKRLAGHAWMAEADVLYTVGFKAHLAGTAAAGLPRVWHLHEFPPRRTGWVWRTLMASLPDRLVAVSGAVARAWQLPERTGVVPNGVDLTRFRPNAPTGWIHDRLHLPRTARLLGMPAVLARWKGHLDVIDAFAAVAERFPDVHLVLIGSAIYDTAAEEAYTGVLEERARAASRVHRLEFQSAVERVYPECVVTVHYSTRAEPFGRVVVESMACGVPVVAAAEGGPLEILGADGPGPGTGGWLVAPRMPDALAATLAELLALDAATLGRVGAAGRRRVEDHFGAEAHAARLCGVLRGGVGRE